MKGNSYVSIYRVLRLAASGAFMAIVGLGAVSVVEAPVSARPVAEAPAVESGAAGQVAVDPAADAPSDTSW